MKARTCASDVNVRVDQMLMVPFCYLSMGSS